MIFGSFLSLDTTRARKVFKIATFFLCKQREHFVSPFMGNSHAHFKVDIKDTNLKDGCSPPTDTLSGLSFIGVCCSGKLWTEL